MGWLVSVRSWAHGLTLFHNGDTTMSYAIMWLAPNTRFASNIDSGKATTPANTVVEDLIARYPTNPEPSFDGGDLGDTVE